MDNGVGDRSGAEVLEGVSEVCLSETGRFLLPFGAFAFSLPPDAEEEGRVDGGVGWPLSREKRDFMCSVEYDDESVERDAKDDASIDIYQSCYYASALSETLQIHSLL